uniref:Taxadiene synthase n=1 Tax=Cephalotaxus sinensis TaxID=89484 RepID=A0AA51BM75_9CONI|nr:chloroplast cephalotene synthase [Cephalotaxus sinensis]
MAHVSICSPFKFNVGLREKSFQYSVNYRAERWLSSKPSTTSVKLLTRPVRMMASFYDSVESSVESSVQSSVESSLQSAVESSVQSSTPRKTAGYHADLWDDARLQCLQSPYDQASSYQERADKLVVRIKNIFNRLQDGEISPSAYDTAWVARVPARDGSHRPQFPQAIKWLLNNQLEDGSWGLKSSFMLCDRLLSTLNSVISLHAWKTGHRQVEQGICFVRENLKSLTDDDISATDFEIIFPALLQKAKSLGLSLPYNLPFIKSLMEERESALTGVSVAQGIPTCMLNTLEGLEESIDWKKIMSFQNKDGSFLSSPASTACVLLHTGDERCFVFLSNLVEKFGGCVPCLYPIDLLERISLVDNIDHLGIGRHFKEEIKVALDYVYRYWSERGIGWGRGSLFPDLNTTALGIRTLRIHGYDVSPDVLKIFKDDHGRFFSCASQRHIDLRSIVNLFRASDLAFPGEKIMDEARLFASQYLRQSLTTDTILCNQKLYDEIHYVLEYSWHLSISILEIRSYIDAYDDNYAWLRKSLFKLPYLSNSYCLELAKLDFNMVQSLHQRELKLLSSWWKESGLAQVEFARQRLAEVYFSVATFDLEYSYCRIAFAKIGCLQFFMDDMYDTYGTLEELRTFTEAVKRWDTSLMDKLPDYMQVCYKVWYEAMDEINREVKKIQGRDMMNHIRKSWEMYLGAYMQEREWHETLYIPTVEEYLNTYRISVGLGPCSLQPILVMGEPVTDDDLLKVHYPSRMFYLVSLTWRLTNDTKTSQAEKDRGQVASSVVCYLKENPGCTEEDAQRHFAEIVDEGLKELNFVYLKSDGSPSCCKKFMFNMRQCVQLIYKYRDGYGIATGETKDYIRKALIDPVQV